LFDLAEATTPGTAKRSSAPLADFSRRQERMAPSAASEWNMLEGERSMRTWHQIASATMTIAFSISLFIASQMYVTSRASAAQSATLQVLKLRNAGYRVSHGR
jgi:hypothetical protein